jgi:hypothetical protein
MGVLLKDGCSRGTNGCLSIATSTFTDGSYVKIATEARPTKRRMFVFLWVSCFCLLFCFVYLFVYVLKVLTQAGRS